MRLRYSIRTNPSRREGGDLAKHNDVVFAPMDSIADGLGGLDQSTERSALDLGSSSYSYFERGDILLAKVTPCFENGKKAHASDLLSDIGFATSEVHVIRSISPALDARYLYYLLSSTPFKTAGVASMTGAGGLRRISDDAVKDYRVPVLDIEHQRSIAAYLDEKAMPIDGILRLRQRQVDLLVEREASLLDRLTFLSPRSKEWPRLPLKWVCRIPSGPVDPMSKPWASMPLIAPNHVERGTGRLSNVESAEKQGAISGKYHFPSGTVVYSKIRPALGKVCYAEHEGLCSADMYPIIPDARLRPQFLQMQLLSQTFTAWAAAESMRVAMPKINRETLGTFELLVPPTSEQATAIATWLSIREQTEAARSSLAQSIVTLAEYRDKLVTDAVNGDLPVRSVVVETTCPEYERWYLPTGWCEMTGSEPGRPRCNDGLRGATKADSLAA